jgi:NAD(P)-dependent dehydrogenase (short-subunit alcohol dehydrogenase family)
MHRRVRRRAVRRGDAHQRALGAGLLPRSGAADARAGRRQHHQRDLGGRAHGGGPAAYLYAGSKGFVSTATHGLAKELVGDRIRVNAVAPGVIQTPFQDRFSTPAMLENFRASIPMGRIGEPEECVGAFLYLASEQLSGYVTGQVIEVNGGQYMP